MAYRFPEESSIVKKGYLKKLKNKSLSKRYVVIFKDTEAADVSKLVYFDSEKKFLNRAEPNKPPLVLKNCFNINRVTSYPKHKHVIALFTDTDCLQLVTESEADQESWLTTLLQQYTGCEDGEQPKPQFEHVWQVDVKEKGLGGSKVSLGPYRLCLTDKTVELIGQFKVDNEVPTYLYQLQAVRRYGHTDCFCYLDVGRHTCTGPGELWMHVEDAVIAQNVHETLVSALQNLASEAPPPMRQRSSTHGRRSRPRTYSESKPCNPHPSGELMRPGSRSPVSTPRSVSALLPTNASDEFRTRSDSVDSRGTTSSLSTDTECEQSPKIGPPRTRTPEHAGYPSTPIMIPSKQDDQSPYVEMDVANITSSYLEMSPLASVSSPSVGGDDPYMSMTPISSSPAVSNKSEDSSYLDMAPVSYQLPTVQEKTSYMDMRPNNSSSLYGTSPQPGSSGLRPNRVHSYLIDNDSLMPKRHNSVGSRPSSKLSLKNKPFMEAIAKQGMLDTVKSCSAPHLIPQAMSAAPLLSSLDNVQENLMEMEFRRRTGSDVGYRPRTSSWTQHHRPRAASHGQKGREKWSALDKHQMSLKRNGSRSSSESLKSLDSKRSSESLTKDGYMDMNFHHVRSGSQPLRQGSDYMSMSLGVKNEKTGLPSSKTGDYVPMNPPVGGVKQASMDVSLSPSHTAFSSYMEMNPTELSQGRRSSIGVAGRKVPVFKLTSAASSDSDSSTSGCHSSHSDLCPSPNPGQSTPKDQRDSNGRGSLSQSSETDESGAYMSLSYEGKNEVKPVEARQYSEIPDSYMPITYDVKKDSVRKSPDHISKQSASAPAKGRKTTSSASVKSSNEKPGHLSPAPLLKGPSRTPSPKVPSPSPPPKASSPALPLKTSTLTSSPLVDSYMSFTPGVEVSPAPSTMKTEPQKVVAYIRNEPADPVKTQHPKKVSSSKKSARKNGAEKLVSCEKASFSDYSLMTVEVTPSSGKLNSKSEKPVVGATPLSSLSVSIPRRSSSSHLSDGESSMPRSRKSITESLPSPSQSTGSRHSSGTSSSTLEPDCALNYASLDLSESTSLPPKSPRKLLSESGEPDSPLTYSQIDFVKSEALKSEPPKLRENRASFNEMNK